MRKLLVFALIISALQMRSQVDTSIIEICPAVARYFSSGGLPFAGYSERGAVMGAPFLDHPSIIGGPRQVFYRVCEVDTSASWYYRKAFYDPLFILAGGDSTTYYRIEANPFFQTTAGVELDASSSNRTLYENGRGAYIKGQIGSQLFFNTTIMESQTVTTRYLDSYIENREVVPGQGIARRFGTNGWDHRWASGNISYTPSQYFNFSLGQGRFFYGNGYRSLFLSDNSLNYPYFRIESTFGPVKYVNLWTQMYDIRNSVMAGDGNRKKWLSTHYLSWNVTDRLNISFFESVMSRSDTNNAGFDVSYLNPIIFYRPIEDQIGSRLGNAVLGMGASYDILKSEDVPNRVQDKYRLRAYGQFVLDEFNLAALRDNSGSWLNKFGYQLGVRYNHLIEQYDGDVIGISVLAEYNHVRPFTYTHSKTLTNYAHYSQPLAHPLGTDFKEWVFRAQATYNRWLFTLHYSVAERGVSEIINGEYFGQGSDLWVTYNSRSRDEGYDAGGSPSVMINNFRAEAFYEFNPSWKMGLFASLGYRSGPMYPLVTEDLNPLQTSDSWWINFGLRTDLFRSFSDI